MYSIDIYQHMEFKKNTCIVQINIFTQQSSNFDPNTSQISTTPTPAGGWPSKLSRSPIPILRVQEGLAKAARKEESLRGLVPTEDKGNK